MVECDPGRLDLPTCETQLQSGGAGRGSGSTSGRGAARALGLHSPRPSACHPPSPPSRVCPAGCLPSACGTAVRSRGRVASSGCPWGQVGQGSEPSGSRAARHAPCQTELSRWTRWTRSPPSALPTAAAGSPATASTGSSTSVRAPPAPPRGPSRPRRLPGDRCGPHPATLCAFALKCAVCLMGGGCAGMF